MPPTKNKNDFGSFASHWHFFLNSFSWLANRSNVTNPLICHSFCFGNLLNMWQSNECSMTKPPCLFKFVTSRDLWFPCGHISNLSLAHWPWHFPHLNQFMSLPDNGWGRIALFLANSQSDCMLSQIFKINCVSLKEVARHHVDGAKHSWILLLLKSEWQWKGGRWIFRHPHPTTIPWKLVKSHHTTQSFASPTLWICWICVQLHQCILHDTTNDFQQMVGKVTTHMVLFHSTPNSGRPQDPLTSDHKNWDLVFLVWMLEEQLRVKESVASWWEKTKRIQFLHAGFETDRKIGKECQLVHHQKHHAFLKFKSKCKKLWSSSQCFWLIWRWQNLNTLSGFLTKLRNVTFDWCPFWVLEMKIKHDQPKSPVLDCFVSTQTSTLTFCLDLLIASFIKHHHWGIGNHLQTCAAGSMFNAPNNKPQLNDCLWFLNLEASRQAWRSADKLKICFEQSSMLLLALFVWIHSASSWTSAFASSLNE